MAAAVLAELLQWPGRTMGDDSVRAGRRSGEGRVNVG
jgi:hypothetical protein